MCFVCKTVAPLAVVGMLATGALPGGAMRTDLLDDLDDQIARAQENQRTIETELADLEASLAEANDRLSDAEIELRQVQGRLPVAIALRDRASADLAIAVEAYEDLVERLDTALEQEREVREDIEASAGEVEAAFGQVANLARIATRGTSDVTTLGIVTGVQSPEDFGHTMSLATSAARARTRSLGTLAETEAIMAGQQFRLEAIAETIAGLTEAAEAQVIVKEDAETVAQGYLDEIEELVVEQGRLLAQVMVERDAIEDDVASMEAAYAQQQEEIASLSGQRDEEIERRREEERQRRIREEEQRQNNNTNQTSPPQNNNQSNAANFLQWPVNNPHVTSHFGYRRHPIRGDMHFHNGTDFRAPCGAPIFAAQSGVVIQSGYNWWQGHHIVIDHGSHNGQNVTTLYSKMQRRHVRVGDWVDARQLIADSGATGISTGCHLHFEVFINGSRVNPMSRLP